MGLALENCAVSWPMVVKSASGLLAVDAEEDKPIPDKSGRLLFNPPSWSTICRIPYALTPFNLRLACRVFKRFGCASFLEKSETEDGCRSRQRALNQRFGGNALFLAVGGGERVAAAAMASGENRV